MQTTTESTARNDHEAYAVHEARALVRGVDECRCRACQRIRNAAAPVPTAWRIIGCTIDGSNHFCLELANSDGECCFVDLSVWTHDDGRGLQLDRAEVVCTQSWTCAAPTETEATAWVKANKSAVEDAVLGALEAAR